jgi:hypothetical protein
MNLVVAVGLIVVASLGMLGGVGWWIDANAGASDDASDER